MLQGIYQAVLEGDSGKSASLTQEALDRGVPAGDILRQGLMRAMELVGEEYERGIRFVPEMLVAAKAMKQAMVILRPKLIESGVDLLGKAVIGTVEGDLHDIGKDLVAMMLEGAGLEVVNLGTEVTAQEFVTAVREQNPDIVGMSALLTTTMIHMPEVIESLEQEELRGKVKVMVGGAPVTQEYAERIGADGYAPDAPAAALLAKTWLSHH